MSFLNYVDWLERTGKIGELSVLLRQNYESTPAPLRIAWNEAVAELTNEESNSLGHYFVTSEAYQKGNPPQWLTLDQCSILDSRLRL